MSTIATLSPLSTPEQRKLAQYEETIDREIRSFVEVGRALLEIRKQKLFRSTDATFEVYCRRRFQFSVSRATQLIGCVEAVDNVENVTTVKPANERQARALAAVPTPQKQADAWAKAVALAPKDDDGKPKVTAAHVRKAVQQVMHPEADEPEDADEQEPEDGTNISDEQPAPIFAALADLPDDMAEAFESFKLSILRHKLSGWTAISRDGAIDVLLKLRELALSPSE